MNTLLNILASLFYKFDNLLILLLAAAVTVIFVYIKKVKLSEAEKTLNPKGSKKWRVAVSSKLSVNEAMTLEKVRDSLEFWYTLYSNLIAVFPLLGLLGTVAALIKISGTETMMDSLMTALSTTLFGVFFAIVFKVLDSMISSKIDTCVDDINEVIRRASREELADYEKNGK